MQRSILFFYYIDSLSCLLSHAGKTSSTLTLSQETRSQASYQVGIEGYHRPDVGELSNSCSRAASVKPVRPIRDDFWGLPSEDEQHWLNGTAGRLRHCLGFQLTSVTPSAS